MLNRAAYRIWQLCDGERDESRIECEIVGEYDLATRGLSADVVGRSVRDHLQILRNMDLS